MRDVRRTILDDGSGCHVWLGATSEGGYGKFGRLGKMFLAHRVAFQAHRGPIPRGMCVLHRCDNPPCVNPAHLFLGTLKDNTQDMLKKGRCRAPYGVHAGRAKLNARKVRAIRRALERGETQHAVAVKFGVGHSTIGRVSIGAMHGGWTHVD